MKLLGVESLRALVSGVRPLLRRRGKVLAVKLGYNPNSSSLGADVTFLLLGASAITVLAPALAAAVRLALRRRPAPRPGAEVTGPEEPPC